MQNPIRADAWKSHIIHVCQPLSENGSSFWVINRCGNSKVQTFLDMKIKPTETSPF